MDLVPTFITNRDINVQRLPTDQAQLMLQVANKLQLISIEQTKVNNHINDLKDILTHHAVKLLSNKNDAKNVETVSSVAADSDKSGSENKSTQYEFSGQVNEDSRDLSKDRFERINRSRQKFGKITLLDSKLQPNNVQYIKRSSN